MGLRSALRIEFTSIDEVTRVRDTVAAYVDEAIAVEAAGLEVGPAPELVLVEELQQRLDADKYAQRILDGNGLRQR